MTSPIDHLTYEDVARTIDHSLLRPELDERSSEATDRSISGTGRLYVDGLFYSVTPGSLSRSVGEK